MSSTLRLILWPTILTLTMSATRLFLEVQGIINNQSGGGGALLGITWLVFAFGGWFGWKLARSGSAPALRWPVLWALLPQLALVVAVMIGFGSIDTGIQSPAAYEGLRSTVNIIVMVALLAAAFCFVTWRRLALTMLLYAIPARLTVVAITYTAKAQEWNTHYTKFGPAGIEVEMGETIYAAAIAQMGFWTPFTVVGGVLAGTLASLATRRTSGD